MLYLELVNTDAKSLRLQCVIDGRQVLGEWLVAIPREVVEAAKLHVAERDVNEPRHERVMLGIDYLTIEPFAFESVPSAKIVAAHAEFVARYVSRASGWVAP